MNHPEISPRLERSQDEIGKIEEEILNLIEDVVAFPQVVSFPVKTAKLQRLLELASNLAQTVVSWKIASRGLARIDQLHGRGYWNIEIATIRLGFYRILSDHKREAEDEGSRSVFFRNWNRVRGHWAPVDQTDEAWAVLSSLARRQRAARNYRSELAALTEMVSLIESYRVKGIASRVHAGTWGVWLEIERQACEQRIYAAANAKVAGWVDLIEIDLRHLQQLLGLENEVWDAPTCRFATYLAARAEISRILGLSDQARTDYYAIIVGAMRFGAVMPRPAMARALLGLFQLDGSADALPSAEAVWQAHASGLGEAAEPDQHARWGLAVALMGATVAYNATDTSGALRWLDRLEGASDRVWREPSYLRALAYAREGCYYAALECMLLALDLFPGFEEIHEFLPPMTYASARALVTEWGIHVDTRTRSEFCAGETFLSECGELPRRRLQTIAHLQHRLFMDELGCPGEIDDFQDVLLLRKPSEPPPEAVTSAALPDSGQAGVAPESEDELASFILGS